MRLHMNKQKSFAVLFPALKIDISSYLYQFLSEISMRVHVCRVVTLKLTLNTENIPGMYVLTNHMRDLVTAENEWVLSHGIELFRKTTRFNLHQFILQKLEVLFLSI